MQKKLTILEVEERKSKAGNKFRVAQCIVHGEKIKVGELMIFKPEIECTPGEYIAVFDISVNFERQVGAELVKLVPFRDAVGAAVADLTTPAGKGKASSTATA